MSSVTSVAPPFDASAQERAAERFRQCPPDEFSRELANYAPTTRAEEISYRKFLGWSLYEAGQYRAAWPYLLGALRRSFPQSSDRAIIRGLIGELCLRTGKLDRAERCSHRALSQLPVQDDGAYLRGGHLCLLGRIYRRQGHLTHAIDTYRRALSLVGDRSPHFTVITASLVFALFQHGKLHEADTLIRAHRLASAHGSPQHQEWLIASVEAPVALALVDVDRAERVLDEALAQYENRGGERVRLVLLDLRAAVLRARGNWIESEQILRSILDRCEPFGLNGDMLACAARGLAESLEGRGDFTAALAPARLAVHAGTAEDRLEWALALHVLGRCLARLGQVGEARRVFQEALSLHERTQFETERVRLEASLLHLGFRDLVRDADRVFEHPRKTQARCQRFDLGDGHTFLSMNERLSEDMRSAAASTLPVLIEGETGTGKELVARLIHQWGPHPGAPFVIVDCATLPSELADVELFGAVRGAYAGSHCDRPGLIAQAKGGTIFLDELPELPPALQAKLLRVLQEGSYRRVGEDVQRRVKVRFVAATNRHVEQLLGSGTLKPDLFYRLNGHRIALLPLRHRRDEIVPLATEIVKRRGLGGLTPAATRALMEYDWPGNVRQLEMALSVAGCRCGVGGILDVGDLEFDRTLSPPADSVEGSLRAGRVAWERARLLRALQQNDGVITKAARSLGLTRQAFYKAMRRTGLTHRDPSFS